MTKQFERAQRLAKQAEQRYRAAMVAFANTTDGLSFLEYWMERCAVNAKAGSRDPLEIMYESGVRDIGVEMVNDFTAARPDAVAVIVQQRATEEKVRNG